MKRKTFYMVILSVIFLFEGCSFPESRPIEGTQNILIGGLDIKDENIVLTMYTDKINQGSESGKEQVSFELFVSEGKTVYEADHRIHEFNEKYLSWFHTKYIIIGEEAAKTGLDRLLSFFQEDDETRLLYRLAIVKGMTAQDFLKQASARKDGLADYLDSLFGLTTKTGNSREIHLLNYSINREIPWNDVFIPAIELIANPIETSDSESGGGSGKEKSGQNYLIDLYGFAIFKEDKLAGFLESSLGRALNILNNDLSGTQITVNGINGHSVSLELQKCSAKTSPKFDSLSMSIEVSMDLNLVEFHDGDNPLDNKQIEYIQQQQNELIKNQILEALKYMQQVGSDAATIGDDFYHKDPIKWQNIKKDWRELFPKVQFNVKVSSKIKSTYELKEPIV